MSIATDSLRSSFAMLDAMLDANLAGVDAELAERRPTDDANDALWVLGHVAFWRSRILEILGAEPVWPAGAHMELQGMKKGPPPSSVTVDFDGVVADLATARDRTLEALQGDVPEEARGDILSLALHEAYHVGQLGLLRRVMGLPGAIGG